MKNRSQSTVDQSRAWPIAMAVLRRSYRITWSHKGRPVYDDDVPFVTLLVHYRKNRET